MPLRALQLFVQSWSDNMLPHSTVEWSVAQCVYDGLAGGSSVIRAAAPGEGECEDSEKTVKKSGAFT